MISWIGGNDFRTLPFDMILSHRQIASAFKPFLYATALETGFSPCSYLENSEKKYPGYEDWEPQNYNHASTPNSTVALWYALANSMNLPTVDLYFKVRREKLLNTCNRLNFPGPITNAPSISLGTLDLSLSEVVRAYSTFANQGLMNELVMINKITNARGGETGTAQNYSDAWFIAYTPDMVLGTWVGASTPNVHFYSGKGSGAALALPIVANVLGKIESDSELNNRYLTSFAFNGLDSSIIQCPPYRENGITGFFNRLFKGNSKNDKVSGSSDKKEKTNSFLKGYLRENNKCPLCYQR